MKVTNLEDAITKELRAASFIREGMDNFQDRDDKSILDELADYHTSVAHYLMELRDEYGRS